MFYLRYLVVFFFFCLFAFSRAAPAAHGNSQARGRVECTAAGLPHSHSNATSELLLRPAPQLTATPDPKLTAEEAEAQRTCSVSSS